MGSAHQVFGQEDCLDICFMAPWDVSGLPHHKARPVRLSVCSLGKSARQWRIERLSKSRPVVLVTSLLRSLPPASMTALPPSAQANSVGINPLLALCTSEPSCCDFPRRCTISSQRSFPSRSAHHWHRGSPARRTHRRPQRRACPGHFRRREGTHRSPPPLGTAE